MQSMADKIVRVIHAAPPLPQYKKVGVYARVSTRSPEQINSLSAQVSELVRMFRNVPLHTIYDVYIDVMSGARTETRPAYQRMLDDCRNNNLDLIDEVRDETIKQMEKYKGAMARYYNKRVKVRRFNIGDLVLRKVSQAIKDLSQGKLGLTWEGPYLKTLDGQELPRPWNIEHLKRYYQ